MYFCPTVARTEGLQQHVLQPQDHPTYKKLITRICGEIVIYLNEVIEQLYLPLLINLTDLHNVVFLLLPATVVPTATVVPKPTACYLGHKKIIHISFHLFEFLFFSLSLLFSMHSSSLQMSNNKDMFTVGLQFITTVVLPPSFLFSPLFFFHAFLFH